MIESSRTTQGHVTRVTVTFPTKVRCGFYVQEVSVMISFCYENYKNVINYTAVVPSAQLVRQHFRVHRWEHTRVVTRNFNL